MSFANGPTSQIPECEHVNESKIDLTHRLQREGRWPEASKFKDDRIASHRSEGTSRKDSQLAAWEEMEQKYPPIAEPSELLDPQDIPADSWEDSGVDFAGDAMWVYSKLACAHILPEDAPSAGAWSLLQWAKGHKDRFYEQTMPKAIATRKKREAEELVDDSYVDNMENIKMSLHATHVNMEERLIANTSETIKQRVKSSGADWQRRFGLNIPREPMESWERQMIHVVDDVTQVAAKTPAAFLRD